MTITFYPERLIALTPTAQAGARSSRPCKDDDKRRHAFLQRLVEERGLRAQLRSGSLLTGQLYVAFDYFPKAPKAKIDLEPGGAGAAGGAEHLVDLEAKLPSILDKLDKLPLEAIGDRPQEGPRDPRPDADRREQADQAASTPSSCPTLKTTSRSCTARSRASSAR